MYKVFIYPCIHTKQSLLVHSLQYGIAYSGSKQGSALKYKMFLTQDEEGRRKGI